MLLRRLGDDDAVATLRHSTRSPVSDMLELYGYGMLIAAPPNQGLIHCRYRGWHAVEPSQLGRAGSSESAQWCSCQCCSKDWVLTLDESDISRKCSCLPEATNGDHRASNHVR